MVAPADEARISGTKESGVEENSINRKCRKYGPWRIANIEQGMIKLKIEN